MALQRCKGRTKAGKRCQNRPAEGSDRCRRHAVVDEEDEKQGPNEKALMRTLRAMGREEDIDAARYQMLRSLAKGVDLAPTRAALWAEYRAAISDLMKDADDADEKLAAAVEALRSAAEVGDT